MAQRMTGNRRCGFGSGTFRLVSCLALVSFGCAEALADRQHGGRYTAQRLANARANVATYDWAKQIRDLAVKRAAAWASKSDDELWAMVPGQDLPRTIDVTMDTKVASGPRRLGCLKCGEKIDKHGNYPYEPNFDKLPWKLTCPSCKVVFPTNDFGAYYASGIDGRGLFDPAKADRSLLFNAEHPDPADPLHTFGVDDGFGYVDGNGRAHKFIGYYTWKYWRHIIAGVQSLADAYLYTGDKTYARKAALVLDRIADVFPSLDVAPYAAQGWYFSAGRSGMGKIEGRIWDCWATTSLVDAYDKILSGTVDNPELYASLERQAQRYTLPGLKGTRELFVKNVDDNLVRCAAAAVQTGRISGNQGMHQRTIATCALALDTDPDTTAWLDWLFAPDGGSIPRLLVGQLDRDGVSPEAAPGYALSWGGNFAQVAGMLAEYPRYAKHGIYRDFPQFRACFTAGYRMSALGFAVPNIGDYGSTGVVGRAGVSPALMADGYRHTRDPAIAVAAWRANGNSAQGLGRDIFAADPDAVSKEIAAHGEKAGPRPAGSSLMSGYGLALLESGDGPRGTALSLYYGRSIFHGHADHLNFDLLAFGKWLTPDHGYPEFATAWPHRQAVTMNTLAHNTVVVDQHPQARTYGGKTRLFKRLPGLSVVSAEAKGAYRQAQEYARTMLLIDAPHGDAYVVDVFQVTGGTDHAYSFHGPPGAVTAAGLALVEQPSGTYAGVDVPFKAQQGPPGYSWWYDVRRDGEPPARFVLDWQVQAGYRGTTQEEKTHLRFHSLSESLGDVALADADPPQNKPGNPRRLTYALLHRTGERDLSSTFAAVIEPYREQPFIRAVERIATPVDPRAVAVRIELADGTVDHVVVNPSGQTLRLVDGLTFTGLIGHVRRSVGKPPRVALVEASEMKLNGLHVQATAAITGKVVKMNRSLDGGGSIWLDQILPTDGSLTGQWLHVANDNERDASYPIISVEREGDLSKVSCGPITFVRGFAAPAGTARGQTLPDKDGGGYLYDFAEGDAFRIPLHAVSAK